MYMKKLKQTATRGIVTRVNANEKLMTYQEASKRLGISVRTLQKRVKSGDAPHVRIGRKVFFTEGLLIEYINSCIGVRLLYT